jgi:6-phosphogluconolactonase
MIVADTGMDSSKIARAKPPRFLTWLAALIISGLAPVQAADMFVYFGTHRSGTNVGFSLAHFDTDTGALTKPEFLLQSPSPAYFVIHPDHQHLYTCNSGSPGAVSAYEIEPHTGQLKFLNRVPAGGADTSYVSLDQTGHYVFAANYSGGNIAVFAIKPDGSLGERTAFVQHTGSSVNPLRQTHAYAHSIIVDPSNRFALVADLGLDKVFVYRFNAQDGTLTPNDPPFVNIKPGSGPRHVKFHPNGRWVYVISEIASTVTAFNWNSTNGTLAEFQSVSALPVDFKGTNTSAEIMVHPNGKFLYASNRGDDSLAVFAIDQATGKLTLVEHVPSGGNTPRNFAFDPTGKWIICSNHGSDNAFVFRVDENTGKLTQTGGPVSVPYPFCERFLPVR